MGSEMCIRDRTNTTSRAGFNGAMHCARQHSLVSIASGAWDVREWCTCELGRESVMSVRACLGGAARHQGCALGVVAAALAELPDTSVPPSGQPNLGAAERSDAPLRGSVADRATGQPQEESRTSARESRGLRAE